MNLAIVLVIAIFIYFLFVNHANQAPFPLFQRGRSFYFVPNPESGELHEWGNEQRTGRWISVERSQ